MEKRLVYYERVSAGTGLEWTARILGNITLEVLIDGKKSE